MPVWSDCLTGLKLNSLEAGPQWFNDLIRKKAGAFSGLLFCKEKGHRKNESPFFLRPVVTNFSPGNH